MMLPLMLAQCVLAAAAGGAQSGGTAYELASRAVDENLSLTGVAPAPAVARYFVADGRVRIDAPTAKIVYLFTDQTMYVIDHPARTVHVLKHSTLNQVAAHYDETVRQLQAAAAAAPDGERAAAERKAADMKSVSDRQRQPVQRDFRVTVRFESVDGRACRVWEESEAGAKRFELCVAPVATVPGGVQILRGMKTLSLFRQGSEFALDIRLGLSDWWPDLARLGGVPLLIREYKYDSPVLEVMLNAIRDAPPSAASMELPQGYRLEEGPDYAQWYLH